MESYKINRTVFEFNKIWYISPSGDDAIGCGSKEYPYMTYLKAYTESCEGDAIIFQEGTYNITPLEYHMSVPASSARLFLEIRKNITLIGAGDKTVVICDNRNKSSVMSPYFFNTSFRSEALPYYPSIYNMHIKCYPNAINNVVFGCAEIKMFNCVIEVLYSGSIFLNENQNGVLSSSLTNCILKGLFKSDVTGHLKKITNCILNSTYNNATTLKQNIIVRRISDDDVNNGNSSDMVHKGLSSIKNIDGSISNIGINGGPYAWYPKWFLFLCEDYSIHTAENGAPVKVADDWRILTSAEKRVLFDAGMSEVPVIKKLKKFKILQLQE